MAKNHIENAVMDEVGALSGKLPLEQIADSCGYAWGGTCIQMLTDLTRFKVLMMTGGSLTESQQAWPPLILEANAQLQCKRAQRRMLGWQSLWVWSGPFL